MCLLVNLTAGISTLNYFLGGLFVAASVAVAAATNKVRPDVSQLCWLELNGQVVLAAETKIKLLALVKSGFACDCWYDDEPTTLHLYDSNGQEYGTLVITKKMESATDKESIDEHKIHDVH